MENNIVSTALVIKDIKLIEKDGVAIGANLISEEGIKYTLFKTKRDGEPTKAYTTFKREGYGVGSHVCFSYKSEPRTFTGNDGNEVTTVNRTITWFDNPGKIEDDIFIPAPKTTTEQAIKEFQAELVEDLMLKDTGVMSKDKDDEIKISDIPF